MRNSQRPLRIQHKLWKLRRERVERELRKSKLLYNTDNLTLEQRLGLFKIGKQSKPIQYWKLRQTGTS